MKIRIYDFPQIAAHREVLEKALYIRKDKIILRGRRSADLNKRLFAFLFITFLFLSILETSFPLVVLGYTIRKVPEQYSTIQAAINAANSGDIIQVAAGTYYEHVLVNKAVKLRGANRASIIDGQLGTPMILNVTASNVEISGFTIQNGGNNGGIWLGAWSLPPPIKTGINITNNALINNGDCVYFGYVTYSIICNNTMENSHYGIELGDSNFNTIKGNTIKGMTRRAIDFYTRSSNNIIINNNMTSNANGVIMQYSSNNNITLNNMASNTGYGVRLSYSTGTLVTCNNITKNMYGAYIWNCSGNQFYHNNFIDNTNQVYHYSVAAPLYKTNLWDTNLYPLTNNTGNYWSDYHGLDNGSGVGRLGEPKYPSDGVGDTSVPHLNVDWYPLMHPWIPVPRLRPVAIFTWWPPELIKNVVQATFNASESYDRDGHIETYRWNFGDGTPVVTETDPITTHMFTEAGNLNVTLTVTDNDGLTDSVSRIVTVLPYKLTIDLYTQKEPYSGRGPNQPSDAFAPQERVILYAEVTYNYNPVQNKPVAFAVTDPVGTVIVAREAYTNDVGIAQINFTLPSNSIFGIYTAIASVSVSEHNATDTLTFRVGWIIQLISLETVDKDGNPKDAFALGETIYFDICLENIAFTPKTVVITVTLFDDCNVTIGAIGASFEITPGTHELKHIFNLVIPLWSLVGPPEGNAPRAVACAFTDWPWMAGEPYCPEVLALFNITRR